MWSSPLFIHASQILSLSLRSMKIGSLMRYEKTTMSLLSASAKARTSAGARKSMEVSLKMRWVSTSFFTTYDLERLSDASAARRPASFIVAGWVIPSACASLTLTSLILT